MPFWCILAQSVVIKEYMCTATFDVLLFLRKRDVGEEKKIDKVIRTCTVVRRDGRVLDSGKCFVPMSHGTFRLPCSFQIISFLNASN